MQSTLTKISEVLEQSGEKPPDKVQSYLALSEILKILFEQEIITFSSYLHFQMNADYEIMKANLLSVPRGTMVKLIANKYNRSTKTVESAIYDLRKERKNAHQT